MKFLLVPLFLFSFSKEICGTTTADCCSVGFVANRPGGSIVVAAAEVVVELLIDILTLGVSAN